MPLRPQEMKQSRLYLLSAAALLLGGCIYICLRPAEPVFFDWAHAAGLGGLIDRVRANNLSLDTLLPEWVVYSLPCAFWAFAYAAIITRIWTDSRHRIKYFWLATIPLLVLGFELLQYPGIIPGTFCTEDLIAGILGSGTGMIIGITHKKQIIDENKNH